MANVLLIGATSTVALCVAKIMAARGDKLYCIARDQVKMRRIEQQLGEAIIGNDCFDFRNYDRMEDALESAFSALGSIDIVLFAHGSLTQQIASEEQFQLAKDSLEINFLSVIAMLIPLMKRLKKQGRGKIGVITSVAGDRGRPRNFTYGAAKGALSIYLQGLRSSSYRSGIEIYDFKLGPVDTPMSASHEKNFSFSSPDKVALLIVRALARSQYTVYVPHYWAWVMWFVRNMPEFLFQRLKFLSAR